MSESTQVLNLALNAILTECGVTYTARFVPQSVSRNRLNKDKSINWIIDLTHKTKPVMSFEYMQGIGHVPGYSERTYKAYDRVIHSEQLAAAETGRYPVVRNGSLAFGPGKALPSPELADILHSIIVEDTQGESFEEWAANFGYDSDSRKALETYEACQKQTRQARMLFGTDVLAKIAELLQDY